MKHETINLDMEGAVSASLSLYIQEDYPETYGTRKRPIVLVCPGGGYAYTSVREGEPIALQFLTAGCHAAVLWYDTSKEGVRYPQSLLELATAVGMIRNCADGLAIDKDKIILAGFSAGGHLAACLGCFWHEEWLEQKMGCPKESYRPNGLILAYPVITSGKYAHKGSFENLLGDTATPQLLEKLSLEKQVTGHMPPTFLWHTFEDGSVPLENSMLFASALREAGVHFEYHVFPHGGHGYALATEETASAPDRHEVDPQCEQWMALCKNWIRYNYICNSFNS